MKEQTKDFRDTFVKAKEPKISNIVLEEIHHDAPDKKINSLIVCDSFYQNEAFTMKQSINYQ